METRKILMLFLFIVQEDKMGSLTADADCILEWQKDKMQKMCEEDEESPPFTSAPIKVE